MASIARSSPIVAETNMKGSFGPCCRVRVKSLKPAKAGIELSAEREETQMTIDARGLGLTGSAEAATWYDRALDHLIRFQSEVVDAAASSAAADPGCVMASLFCAYLALMSTE